MTQMSVMSGRCNSTATGYLAPARGRRNLTILGGAEAMSLILEGRKCVGVRFRHKGSANEARASRQVIVSGGTINTPKLLELSGIGNLEVLGSFGIPIVQTLPGVGENLRDHYGPALKWTLNQRRLS